MNYDELVLSKEKTSACRDLVNHTAPNTETERTLLMALRYQIQRADNYRRMLQDILEELN